MWFGKLGFFLNSLNHCQSAQHLTEFKSCDIKSKEAPPSDPHSSKLTLALHTPQTSCQQAGEPQSSRNNSEDRAWSWCDPHHWWAAESKQESSEPPRDPKIWWRRMEDAVTPPGSAFLTINKLHACGLQHISPWEVSLIAPSLLCYGHFSMLCFTLSQAGVCWSKFNSPSPPQTQSFVSSVQSLLNK